MSICLVKQNENDGTWVEKQKRFYSTFTNFFLTFFYVFYVFIFFSGTFFTSMLHTAWFILHHRPRVELSPRAVTSPSRFGLTVSKRCPQLVRFYRLLCCVPVGSEQHCVTHSE